MQIHPTRIELKKCKVRLAAATNGHKLLKDKLEEMVRQFLILAANAKSLRLNSERDLQDSTKGFATAKALSSGQNIKQAITTKDNNISINISSQNIMGVTVPVFDINKSGINPTLPYALATVPFELDNAIRGFTNNIAGLLKLAEAEKSCALLADEIEKTRRRVNALEHIVIPDLLSTIKYIQMRLDENERGAIVRLMKVKSNLEKKES